MNDPTRPHPSGHKFSQRLTWWRYVHYNITFVSKILDAQKRKTPSLPLSGEHRVSEALQLQQRQRVRPADGRLRVQARPLLEPHRGDAVPRPAWRRRRRRRQGQHEAQRQLSLPELALHAHQDGLHLRPLLPEDRHDRRQRLPHAGRQRRHGLV